MLLPTIYSDLCLGLTGAQVTGVQSSILLAQTVDDESHGVAMVEQLMLVTGGQDYTILPPDGGDSVFRGLTLQADPALFLP